MFLFTVIYLWSFHLELVSWWLIKILDLLIYTKSGITVFILVVEAWTIHIIKGSSEELWCGGCIDLDFILCPWWTPCWGLQRDGCELKELLSLKAALDPYKFQHIRIRLVVLTWIPIIEAKLKALFLLMSAWVTQAVSASETPFLLVGGCMVLLLEDTKAGKLWHNRFRFVRNLIESM